MSARMNLWTKIRSSFTGLTDTYRILGGVLLVGVGVLIGAVLFANPQADGYTTNLYTEFISIAITVFVLDYLNRRRDDARRIRELKEDLLRQVRSPEPTIVRHAIHEIRERGWLTGGNGILQGADLRRANLQGANLEYANLQGTNLEYASLQGANLEYASLQGTNLEYANLQEADLQHANLQGANLEFASLQGANLEYANLQGADLQVADLRGTDLQYANLQGANLEFADLQGANLRKAKLQGAYLRHANLQGADLVGANLQEAILPDEDGFDETTILPDAVAAGRDANRKLIYTPDSYYKPGVIDMRKYTDPDHPDFWQP